MEQNIDAYRIMAEILGDFRTLFQQSLEAVHGDQWSILGIPPKTRKNLAAQKETERAIDWFDSESHELMVYATFDDFLEILQVNDTIFPAVTALAPSQPLLHTRFLELEVMRKKLGLARAISEAELSFLGSFHMRFRKSLATTLENRPELIVIETQKPASAIDNHENDLDEPIIDQSSTQKPVDQNATVAIDIPANDDEVEQIMQTEESLPDPATSAPTDPNKTQGLETDSARSSQPPVPAVSANLKTALEDQDSKYILKQLYTEITSIAEGMWSNSQPVVPTVWEIVRVSPWYESQFSRLGLKPVSDFYEIIGNFHERVERGEPTNELQRFLKDCNFAHVLLALRDVFQRMQVY